MREEQLFALQEFPKSLEQYFNSFQSSQRLYFERRDGQYKSEPIEKTRIITFANMIRAFAAMFLNEPHRTTRNFGRLKAKVGKEIFAKHQRMEPYYVAALGLYKFEFMFRNGKIAPSYKQAKYHMLLAFRIIVAGYEMPEPIANKMESYCTKIIDVLNNSTKCEEYMVRSAAAIEEAAEGNFHRDNIRSEPFTERVIAASVKAQKTLIEI